MNMNDLRLRNKTTHARGRYFIGHSVLCSPSRGPSLSSLDIVINMKRPEQLRWLEVS